MFRFKTESSSGENFTRSTTFEDDSVLNRNIDLKLFCVFIKIFDLHMQ